MAFLDAIHGRIIDPERDSRHVLEQALSERRQIIANRRLAEMEAMQRAAELAAEKEAQAAEQAEAIKYREAQERMHGESLKSQAALQDKIGEQEFKRQKASTLYGERLTARRRKEDLVSNRAQVEGYAKAHNAQLERLKAQRKAATKPEDIQALDAKILNYGGNLPASIRQYVDLNPDGSVIFKGDEFDRLIKSEDDYIKMLSVEESGAPAAQALPPGTGAAIAGGPTAANWLAGMPSFGGPVSRKSGGVRQSAVVAAAPPVVAPNPPGGGGGRGIGPALAPGRPTVATPPFAGAGIPLSIRAGQALGPMFDGSSRVPMMVRAGQAAANFFGRPSAPPAGPMYGPEAPPAGPMYGPEAPPAGPMYGPEVPITDSDHMAYGGGGDFGGGGGLGSSLGIAPTMPGSGILRPPAPVNRGPAYIGAGGTGMFGAPNYDAMEQQRMQREAEQRAALEASGYDIVGYE